MDSIACDLRRFVPGALAPGGRQQFGSIQVRLFEEGDECAVNDGFNAVFSLRRGLDEWRWKFPPWEGVAVSPRYWIVLAEEVASDALMAQGDAPRPGIVSTTGQALAAVFAALPMPMQLDGRALLGAQGVDSYSMPAYRCTRAYGRAVEAFFATFFGDDRVSYFYGYAGERNTQVLTRHYGFDACALAPLWTRGQTSWWLRSWPVRSHRVRFGFDAAAVDALWARAAKRYGFSVIRDARWYARRFGGRPGVDYLQVSAWRDGRMAACAVLRHTPERIDVADWLWDGEDTAAIRALDRHVARLAAHHGVRQEMWLAGDEALAGALAANGWAPTPLPAPNHLVVRCTRSDVRDAIANGRHYVTMGDADLV